MYYNCKKRTFIIMMAVVEIAVLTSCAYKNNDKSDIYESSTIDIIDELEPKTNEPTVLEQNTNSNDCVDITILATNTISINKNRIGDGDIYGVDHIDNKWSLSEIDDILNAIKGNWTIDGYVGFVAPTIYYLPERFDNISEDARSKAQNDYDEKVEIAKANIPVVNFSIKEYDGKDSDNNYIYVNDNYLSPISIVLSLDRSSDSYPIFKEQTAISGDFFAEYPVLYVKFFIEHSENGQIKEYEPATLVITSDNRFYILVDGAFYSLKSF
jgi:hypothetical protein